MAERGLDRELDAGVERVHLLHHLHGLGRQPSAACCMSLHAVALLHAFRSPKSSDTHAFGGLSVPITNLASITLRTERYDSSSSHLAASERVKSKQVASH